MSGHPSAELLARYSAGDLRGRQSGRIRAHLGGCAACPAVLENLDQVSLALSAAPPPELPRAVADRLDAALAAAVAERASGAQAPLSRGGPAIAPEPGRPIPGRPDLPERAGASRRRAGWGVVFPSSNWARGLAAAAAVVVVASGGLVVERITAGPIPGTVAGASSASHGQGGGATVPGPMVGESRNAPLAAGNYAQPAVVTYELAGVTTAAPVVVTQTQLTSASMAAEVRRLLTTYADFGDTAAPTPSAPAAKSATAQGVPLVRLSGCLSRLSAGQRILVVEVGWYQDRPATFVVTPEPGKPDLVRVTVVGSACSKTNSDVIARTLVPPGG